MKTDLETAKELIGEVVNVENVLAFRESLVEKVIKAIADERLECLKIAQSLAINAESQQVDPLVMKIVDAIRSRGLKS